MIKQWLPPTCQLERLKRILIQLQRESKLEGNAYNATTTHTTAVCWLPSFRLWTSPLHEQLPISFLRLSDEALRLRSCSFMFRKRGEKKKSQTGGALAGRAAVEHRAICDQQAQTQSEWFRAHANSCWQLNQSKLAWCKSNLLSRWSPRQNTDTVPLIIIIIMVLLEIILQSTLEALWRLTRFLRTWNNNRTDRKDAEKNQNTEGRGVKLSLSEGGKCNRL